MKRLLPSKVSLVPSVQEDETSTAPMIAQQSASTPRGMHPRAGGSASAEATAGTVQGQPAPAPPVSPSGTEESLDSYIDDPSLLLRIAHHVLKIVSKELPNPGESSEAYTSDIWVHLK